MLCFTPLVCVPYRGGTQASGATPLYIASMNGHVEVVTFLIARGAVVQHALVSREVGQSALGSAFKKSLTRRTRDGGGGMDGWL